MKKKTKFSLGMKIVTLLTVITMASVGFAAWVITAPAQEEAQAGTIMVDEVEDQSTTFESKWVGNFNSDIKVENPIIKFGKNDYEAVNPWLDNADLTENLEAFLYIKVTNKAKIAKTISVKLDGIFGEGTVEEKILAGNAQIDAACPNSMVKPLLYQVNSTNGNTIGSAVEYDNALTFDVPAKPADQAYAEEVVVIKIRFDWGLNFADEGAEKGINAFEYFNDMEWSVENQQRATEALTALYEAINGLSYQVTVKVAA